MNTYNFFIKTYGCQMNVLDSVRMANVLKNNGFNETNVISESDIVIYNTCSVRENVRNKVLSDIGDLKNRTGKKVVVALGGCVGAQEGKNLFKNTKIDIIFGPDQVSELGNLLREFFEKGKRVIKTDFYSGPYSYNLEEIKEFSGINLISKATAYVSISQGCNNFCSYCIVPYSRGREKSRTLKEIIMECEFRIDNGKKEIILLGQNVNSWGKDLGENFIKLLEELDKLGIRRLRFLVPHPRDFSQEHIEGMLKLNSFSPYIHLPTQSGSDKILSSMNRQYDRKKFLFIVNEFRKKVPDFAFGTDLIVGFPGESEEDFQDTLALMSEVKFENIFSFKYSPRPGTRASKWKDSAPQKTKEERLSKLHDLQKEIYQREAKKHVGEIWEVLVEDKSLYGENFLGGRSPEYRYINFKGEAGLIGEFVSVKVTDISQSTYKGEMVIPKH
jgi:tRNA-2-methylthio-N6-dimethylallyladenosine synthase